MRKTLLVLLFLCLCPVARAGELSKGAIAARDFGYKGIKIGSTIAEFKRVFPKTELSDGAIGVKVGSVYLYTDQEIVKAYHFSFFDGKVYSIVSTLTESGLEKLGGQAVVRKKVFDTFGMADQVIEKGAGIWHFPEVDRRFFYDETLKPLIGIGAFGNNACQELLKYQAEQVNLGF